MELGSGSTQISFLPAQPPLSGIFPVRVGGVVYQLYTHSYLNYGQDRAYIQTALNIIRKDSITSNIVPHPCVLAGKWSLKSLRGEYFLRSINIYIYAFYIIWDDTVSWNNPLWKMETSLTYIVNMTRGTSFYCFHDDVIKWERFPLHWPFVKGIHWSLVHSPSKGPVTRALMFSFVQV